ncbi:MAG: hypothetical protein HFG80_07685 [Eubacterium sp.]|jgi:hypothetical protein|nr:hypothetical protein [Eubacterium sp.]
MNLKRTEQKLRIQQSIIEQLEEENRYLKEQLKTYCPERTKQTIALARQSQEEYTDLIRELDGLKQEYQELINGLKQDKKKLLRNCR